MLAKFEEHLKSLGTSKHTIRGYLSDLNGAIRQNIISIELSDIDMEKLLKLPIKISTKKRIVSSIKKYAKFLVWSGKIDRIPAIIDTIEFPREYSGIPRVANMEAVKEVIKKTKNREIRAILSVLSSTGCRLGSLTGLKDSDIQDNKIVFTVAKGNKPYISILNKGAIEEIKEWQKERGPANYLFPTADNKQATVDSLRMKLIRTLGSDYINPHSIRHCFATLLVEKDINIFTVKELMNHSHINTTQRYVHLNMENKIKEVEGKIC